VAVGKPLPAIFAAPMAFWFFSAREKNTDKLEKST
jgi:hypothetical protein